MHSTVCPAEPLERCFEIEHQVSPPIPIALPIAVRPVEEAAHVALDRVFERREARVVAGPAQVLDLACVKY